MNSITHARYQQTQRERFHQLLRWWLAGLSAEGWSGTVADLWEQLDGVDRERKLYAFVPTASGLSKALAEAESIFTAAGWSIAWKRTAKARRIEVRPRASTG